MLLNKPILVNGLTLRNRVVMPPMATGKAENGAPSEEMIQYYAARAKTAGLIIVEHEYVSLEGMARKNQLSMSDKSVLDQYKKLTDEIHRQGGLVFSQISHAGVLAKDSGLTALVPSMLSGWKIREDAREMTSTDIQRLIEYFVNAAMIGKQAGFDGVEIHSAHGYLLNQFYSPLCNRREDRYNGNTLKGRTMLHCEILRAIRSLAGTDYAIAIRFGAYDYLEGGSLVEDIPDAVRAFVDAGADMIDISGGLNGYMIPGESEPGWFTPLSRKTKSAVPVPVMVTGGIKTKADAEKILAENDADLVGIGRAMMKNPNWPNES